MAAAAMTAPPAAMGVAGLTAKYGATFVGDWGGIEAGSWHTLSFGPHRGWEIVGFPASQFDRDALAFNRGVEQITRAVETPSRIPAVVDGLVDKLADIVTDTIAKIEPEPIEPEKPAVALPAPEEPEATA